MSNQILVSESQIGGNRCVTATSGDHDGNRVQVQVSFPNGAGAVTALGILARTVIELLSAVRKAPVERIGSLEMEGGRWNG